jgi:DNA-binding LacI/PurR family transcriptional regulator
MAKHNSIGRVSIKDVAAEAHISVSTASRALNNHPDVSDMTRERVIQVADELGYERNPFARSLISGKSGLIAVILYEFDNDYHLQLLKGLNRSAKKHHQELLFAFTQSREETIKTCMSVYRRGMADGALVFSPVSNDLPHFLELQSKGFPVVLINPAPPYKGLTSIGPQDYEGAITATQHLIDLGHRRIGIVVESEIWGAGRDRLRGYRTALQQAELKIDEALILIGYSGFPEFGRSAIRDWMRAGVKLSAVVCFNDLLAYGLIHELNTLALRVPDDVSVIGFDDVPNSQYFATTGLTTMRQPIAEIGARALEMLVDLVHNRIEPGIHVSVPMELIIRGTTKPASH